VTHPKTGGPIINPFKIAGVDPGSGRDDHD
jgi:hypothetical protein